MTRSPVLPGPAPPERTILVGVRLGRSPKDEVQEHLDELERLLDSAGGEPVGRLLVERPRPDAATFIGTGKVSELTEEARRLRADLIVFDDDLSPAQSAKIEKQTGVRVIDRSALILDIFARRARTREARLQVELAQMRYLLPRLTRRWSHLSRQVGGIGVRGVGETQLEIDRRLVRRRIAALQRDLERLDRGRAERRKRRLGAFQVALVGYTNSGKTTLLNALTGASGLAEDRLFATLDPLVRKLPGAGPIPILIIDTVGFVRKLPHALVASFRSTLEEALSADLLMHVVDLSHPEWEAQAVTTIEVLTELGVGDRPIWIAFNKDDGVAPGVRERALRLHPEARLLSAREGTGLDPLRRALRRESARWGAERGLVPLELLHELDDSVVEPGAPRNTAGEGGRG